MSQQQDSGMSETKPKSSQRFHSLNTEQVEVLHQVLSEVVPIHGRGNFPTLELRPRDIIIAVRARLQKQGITVRDVRLNGSTASHVLVRDNGTTYKDLDIIFGVELPSQEEFQVIKESVLGCLLDCLPAGVNRERISSATMKEAYVQKMVKVFNEYDRWSLISLSNNSGKNLELKFVSILRRQFEFSVDSFQIILDRLLESYMQQDSQSRISVAHLKDRSVENDRESSQSPPKQPPPPEKSSGNVLGKQAASGGQTQPRDEVLKKTQHSQSGLSNQARQPNAEEPDEEKMPAELKDEAANLEKGSGQPCPRSPSSEKKEEPSEQTEASTQSELVQELEFSENTTPSTQAEHSEQSQPCGGSQPPPPPPPPPPQELLCQSENTKPPTGHKDLTEQREASEEPQPSNETQPGSPQLAGEDVTDPSKSFHKGQRSNEESETQRVCASEERFPSQAETDTQLAAVTEAEGDAGEAERKITMEINEETGEILGSGAKNTEYRESIDFPPSTSSTSLTIYNQQPAGTPDTLEIPSSLHISDKTSDTVDGVSPPDTQDNLSAPPCLSSDKKTSSSSSKASDRLSHMVVLKHSSPKPPRRMCKKVVQSYQNPLSENEALRAPCPGADLSPNLERQLSSDPKQTALTAPPTNSVATPPNPRAESQVASSLAADLDLTSAPAPDSTSATEACSPSNTDIWCETRILGPKETQSTHEDQGEESQLSTTEAVPAPEQMEPPDSAEITVWHSEEAMSPTPTPTPEPGPSEVIGAEEQRESWSKTLESSGPNSSAEDEAPSTSHCVTSPVTCATPPLLSLPLPSFTPSPPSLSPSPCLTPPPLCLSPPGWNASAASSSNSPPLSFSPSSSCLGSPYLTPPMLSLSSPPLCLSPPSPCLSPPLLCLTPPVEPSGGAPQVSLDAAEPLMLNANSEEHLESCPQPEIPSLPLEGLNGQDYPPSLPRGARPVSFPIAIPSSTTHLLPPSPSGSPGEFTPPKADEASSTAPEKKDIPKVAADTPEQKNPPQASDSVPAVEVLAESMYGDFEAAMDHLRYRLIATRNPEEIRGGGLLKYSNLLVRDYRPASETQIKTLERYMCSRFFIDFPDVQEQQRKILSYLKNHFIGEERSKYQYLMTLRRVVDDSTVCLMGHERRQTLNMITVLALKVLGEQNIIPNTDHVTCFYQPAPYLAEHSAPYMAEPSYCNYFIPQGASTLLYQPYPLHLHTQTGLV